jgi:hypothetical protein
MFSAIKDAIKKQMVWTDGPPCPVCHRGQLEKNVVLMKRLKQTFTEFHNPLMALRVLYKPYLSQVKKGVEIWLQWRCTACRANLLYCDAKCKKPWFVRKELTHLETATCPTCKTLYYCSLG